MTDITTVNTGQAGAQVSLDVAYEPLIFHVKAKDANLVFTLLVIILLLLDIIMPLAFSHKYCDYHGCYAPEYVFIWIGDPIGFIVGFIFMCIPSPQVVSCGLYMITQVIALFLFWVPTSDIWHILIIGAIVLNICYVGLLMAEIRVIFFMTEQQDRAKKLAQNGQRTPTVLQQPPTPSQPTAPVTVAQFATGNSGPAATTTVITTYNAVPGQPVIIPREIPAIHGIPPGPLNPATLASNQVYTRTISNMYPAVPQLGQMAPDSLLPSPNSPLYNNPSMITVSTIDHQNASNPVELYDMPPGLVDDHDEPSKEGTESKRAESERPESPSPSDFSKVSSSSYEIPPEECLSSK